MTDQDPQGRVPVGTEEGPEHVLVLAGTYRQYLEWCQEHGRNPRHQAANRYLRDEQCLRGFWGVTVVRYGTWYDRPDLKRIWQYLHMVEARVVDS